MFPEFNNVVREEFAPVAEAHGFRETGSSEKPVLQRIVFSDERRVVRFYLDVRDGYLDAQYSTRTVLNPDGTLRAAPPGTGFATYQVPSANVYQAGNQAWVSINGGNSLIGRFKGLPPGMPPFIDLGPWLPPDQLR